MYTVRYQFVRESQSVRSPSAAAAAAAAVSFIVSLRLRIESKIERHATTPSSTTSLSILLPFASHIGRALIFAMRQQ